VTRLLRDGLAPLTALLLAATALALPPRPHGDAGEYLLMLESFARHGTPDLRAHDAEALRARLQDEGLTIDEARYLPNYQRGRDGRLYCYHFWGYSLAGWPVRVLLERLGLPPLRALPLTNALVFGLALWGVASLPWSGGRRLLFGGLLLFSPALAFLLWPHPEMFSFALVALALALEGQGRRPAAALAAALASLQNPPLVLLVFLLGGLALADAVRRRQVRPLGLALAAGLAAAAAPLFFLWQFGVFNLSVRPSEAAQSLSLARALDLAVDPDLGLLPHAPLTLIFGVAMALLALARRRFVPAALVLLLLPLVAFATTANSNWNNDTSGPSRYTVWMLPLVAFVLVGASGEAPGRPLRPLAAWGVALALATQAAVVLARGGPLARSDFLEHSAAARFVLDHFPGLYAPTPEVFVERTLGREDDPASPVIYRDAAGRCRKAWLQARHARELLAACGAPEPVQRARLLAAAGGRETKRGWLYVSY